MLILANKNSVKRGTSNKRSDTWDTYCIWLSKWAEQLQLLMYPSLDLFLPWYHLSLSLSLKIKGCLLIFLSLCFSFSPHSASDTNTHSHIWGTLEGWRLFIEEKLKGKNLRSFLAYPNNMCCFSVLNGAVSLYRQNVCWHLAADNTLISYCCWACFFFIYFGSMW
jgi:hypothetical protein